jgi:hypothetical protein
MVHASFEGKVTRPPILGDRPDSIGRLHDADYSTPRDAVMHTAEEWTDSRETTMMRTTCVFSCSCALCCVHPCNIVSHM